MKSEMLTWITVMSLFAAPATPLRLMAQEQNPKTHYIVTDLGTLGGTFSIAGGLNDRGSVEGFSTLPGDATVRAYFWQNGVMTDLGTLGGPNSFAAWPPNARGEVGGAAETATPDPLREGFCTDSGFRCLPYLWQKGVMTPLPTLGGNNGAANETNNRGQVVGNAENTTAACLPPEVLEFRPVLWEKGKVQELPTILGDSIGEAHAINDHAQATGQSGSCANPHAHALLWQDGKVTDLGNLGGTTNNRGTDINNQGQVVGLSGLSGDATFHAFLWQNGVMTDLGTLPGDVSSEADGINSKGQVVGGSFDKEGNSRAFLWQSGTMTDLNTLIPADSTLVLLEVTGINSRGQIAGVGLEKSTGEIHAFLATPTDQLASDRAALTERGESSQSSKAAIPESVRKLLRQRLGHWYHFSGASGWPPQ